MGKISRVLLAALPAVLAGCLPLTVSEHNFLSTHPKPWPVAAGCESARGEPVTVAHADGNTSHGVHLAVQRPVATVLLFLGNGEVLDEEGAVRLWQLCRHGVDGYVFDRRGYGRTAGRPRLATLGADALDAYDFVRARARQPVIVHGFSLGSMVAGHVVAHRPVDALVLEGSSPTARDWLDVHFPWYLRPVFRVRLAPDLARVDNGAVVRAYDGPLLIAAGENDPDTIPELSRKLYALATSPHKRLAIIPGAEHHALTTPAGFEVYRSFIASVAAASAASR